MKWIEQGLLYVTVIFIAIFAHPELTYEFSTPKYAFLILWMVAIMGLFTLRHLAKGKMALTISLAHWGWFLFGVSALVSTLTVFRENPHYFRYSFEIAIYAFFTVFMVFYLSNAVNTKPKITLLFLALLVSGFLVAIEAFMNYYTGNSFFLGNYGEVGKMAMRASIGNVNFVSDYMASLIPLAIYFAISFDFGWKLSDTTRIRPFLATVITIKAFSLVCFSMFLVVVLLSGTRGVILSLILGFVVLGMALAYYHIVTRKHRKDKDFEEISVQFPRAARLLKEINRTSVVAICFLAILFVVLLSIPGNPIARGSYSVAERTISIFDEHGFQVTGGKHRILAWLSSWYQWKETPVIGTGIGTYQLHAVTYMGEATQDHPQYIDAWSNFKRTHNDYFQLLGEMGLFGVAAVALTLIAMVILFFKMLKTMVKPDNAYLLMLIAVGFIQMLGHSFTEFPLHLLPNALLATIYAAVGMGVYFNAKNHLAKTYTFRRRGIMIILLALLLTAIPAGVLKWQSVGAEVEFKKGSSHYSGISQFQNHLRTLQERLNEIALHKVNYEARAENYAPLEKETFVAFRMSQLQNQNPDTEFDLEKLRAAFIQELDEILIQEKKRLEQLQHNTLQEMQAAEQRVTFHFQRSRDHFLQSLSHVHCYGKSSFYLSLLMTSQPRRAEWVQSVEKAGRAMDVLGAILQTGWEDTRFIEPKVRDFPFYEDLNLIERAILDGNPQNQIFADFQIFHLIDGQRFQDQIDYLETTFMGFNEKNAYPMIGRAYLNLKSVLLAQSSLYDQLIARYPQYRHDLHRLSQQHRMYAEFCFEFFQQWFDQAITIMPGNWNMFPEWQSLYREYIEHLMRVRPLPKVYNKVREVAERRVWASHWMLLQNRDGAPNDIAMLYRQLADALLKENHIQETLIVLDDALGMMQDTYAVAQRSVKENPHLSVEGREQIQLFIQNYEDLQLKRAQFLEQVRQVYRNAYEAGEFDQLFLEDWQHNIFTGETNSAITFEQIMNILN